MDAKGRNMMCKLNGQMGNGRYDDVQIKAGYKGWIYLLARRNLLWDILRLPSSRRVALGLYVILTL